MAVILYIAAGIVAVNVIIFGVLALLAIEDDRRWRRVHGGRGRKKGRDA